MKDGAEEPSQVAPQILESICDKYVCHSKCDHNDGWGFCMRATERQPVEIVDGVCANFTQEGRGMVAKNDVGGKKV